MRRLDMLDVLGYLPEPEITAGKYLVDVLFKVGPIAGEGPITEQQLEIWERRRGIELAPWQADALIEMSRAYLREMHTAKDYGAVAPWPKARNMWKYVCDQKNGAALQASLKEELPNGGNKRRRNPPSS